MTNLKRAFSLFELSVVIAIIALLITMGIGSRNIIKNYEQKNIMAQLNDYSNAFKAFYQIYKNTPGDSSKGYRLFGDTALCVNSVNNDSNNNDDTTTAFKKINR